MNKPFILVTNDDGFEAPGIHALVAGLRRVGDVAVVAPEAEQSGVGRHITLHRPLRARQRGPLTWSVDGTPTDCVYLAIYELLDRRPDLVISGINRGPNLAQDVLYSGTVAGALEGASIGVPACAISLDFSKDMHYAPSASFAADIARYMLDTAWPSEIIVNVNVPNTDGAPVTGYRWVRTGLRDYRRQVTRRLDPRGQPYYWIGGAGLGHHAMEGSDCDTLANGCATITPLRLEMTDFACLDANLKTQIPGYLLL